MSASSSNVPSSIPQSTPNGRGRGLGATRGGPRGRGNGPARGRGSPAVHTRGSTTARGTFPRGGGGGATSKPRGSAATQPLPRGDSSSTRGITPTRPPSRGRGAKGVFVPKPMSLAPEDVASRYESLKYDRTKQRQEAIAAGRMADPEQPTSLKQAITPKGTCTEMCPEFERVERIVQKTDDKCERSVDPKTGASLVAEHRMIKRFRRSAAGNDEQLPSDIRTPETLLQTVNFLLREVIGDDDSQLGLVHKFVWDRTRSIRNDLSIQQLSQSEDVKVAVKCLERIARFHIISLHLLSSENNTEQFDHHQEREQLNNTLLSLIYYYNDNRGRVNFPHEDEFRAYYIVFSVHDQRPDLESRIQKWPSRIRDSPRVQLALELLASSANTWEYQGTLDSKRPNSIAQGFYSRFFDLISSDRTSYILACIAEIYFSQIRQTAIRSIWKAYLRQPLSTQGKNQDWTVNELTNVLHFDNDEQTIRFCEEQDLTFAKNEMGQKYLDWGQRSVNSIAFQPSSGHVFSHKCVEKKRCGRTLPALILGMSVLQAKKHNMIRIPASHPVTAPAPTPLFAAAPPTATTTAPSAQSIFQNTPQNTNANAPANPFGSNPFMTTPAAALTNIRKEGEAAADEASENSAKEDSAEKEAIAKEAVAKEFAAKKAAAKEALARKQEEERQALVAKEAADRRAAEEKRRLEAAAAEEARNRELARVEEERRARDRIAEEQRRAETERQQREMMAKLEAERREKERMEHERRERERLEEERRQAELEAKRAAERREIEIQEERRRLQRAQAEEMEATRLLIARRESQQQAILRKNKRRISQIEQDVLREIGVIGSQGDEPNKKISINHKSDIPDRSNVALLSSSSSSSANSIVPNPRHKTLESLRNSYSNTSSASRPGSASGPDRDKPIIDEDEMLFSAARLATTTLADGKDWLDDWKNP